jgi:phospholipase/carboxylesterase
VIDETHKWIPKKNIYLMGFSQGACLSLEVASRFAEEYGGVAAFIGGLIGQQIQPEKYQGDFKQTPIVIINSDKDPHVPLSRSEASAKLMGDLGGSVTLKVYPNLAHTIHQAGIDLVKEKIFGK